FAGRLDHHPDQRLRPGRPHQHPTPSLERARLPLDRAVNLWAVHRAGQRRAVLGTDVHEALWELLHRVALVKARAAQRLEQQQRARDPVARWPEPEIDDVSRLLTPQRPAPTSELVEDVA